MNNNNFVVIMAGGVGSRFWPYSRNARPKQFLDILGVGKSLLQLTFNRFAKIVGEDNILVVTNDDYAQMVKDQLPAIKEKFVLAEPMRRNTAPCIAYASYLVKKENPDAVIVVAPSDHLILNEEAFQNTMQTAIDAAASQDKLITIGLKPNRPETGFGYIQFKESGDDVKPVKTFTEKPEKELAEKFIESGDFVWNSGIFAWGVKAIVSALENSLPEMAESFAEIEDQLLTDAEHEAVGKAYSQCINISIDFGVMEKADNVYTVLGDFGWSDLGSWNSLYDLKDKDENGNVVNADALLYNTKNSLIQVPEDKLVVVQGLEGYLVTETDNVVLICKKDEESMFREFVKDVKENKGKEYL